MEPGLHVPAPSQVRARFLVDDPAGHEADTHTVPATYFWQAPAPSHLPLNPHAAGPASVQPETAGMPAPMFVHMPTAPGRLHARQPPEQSMLQHTPCEQNPVTHSPPAPHIEPTGFLPQLPAMHAFPVTQSPSPEQVVLHALVAASQRNGAQVWVPPGLHAPAPSQVDSCVRVLVPAGQLAGLHTAPDMYRWQPPAPLHVPSFPHAATPPSLHVPVGSEPPVGTLMQVPAEPVRLQAVHDAMHAWLQHTPCAQKPDRQSTGSVQAAPSGFLPHEPITHLAGATQLSSAVHDVKQAAPLHLNGAQLVIAPGTHLFAASHFETSTRVEPVQDAAAHTVPTAYLRHAPAPSQVPSSWHDAAPVFLHTARGSATPAAVLMQSPGVMPAQVRHAPAHASLQQTPSAQKPDAHSAGAAQVWPGPFLPHDPIRQSRPGAQSSLLVHEPRHPPSRHVKGAQSMVAPPTHLPEASHALAVRSRVPMQAAGPHALPAG